MHPVQSELGSVNILLQQCLCLSAVLGALAFDEQLL
jgi:hypothetical protein